MKTATKLIGMFPELLATGEVQRSGRDMAAVLAEIRRVICPNQQAQAQAGGRAG